MCEIIHSQELDKIAQALAKAQGDMKPAAKDAQNPHLKSSYASLSSVREAIRVPFAENGLSISQLLFGDKLVTLLLHESGQWLRSEIVIETPEANRGINNLQAIGSTLTYLRRYALSAIAGVSVGDEDDDGQSGGDVKIKRQARQAPKQQAEQSPTKPPKADEPERPYSPDQFKAKIASLVSWCHANRTKMEKPYHDKETGDAFPIRMHSNKDAAKIIAAQWQKALKDAPGIEDEETVYHDSLAWLFDGITSANDLDSVHAMALFKLMFNGNEPGFEAEMVEFARQELAAIAQVAMSQRDEIPF